MPAFRYTGDDTRVFPDLGITVEPGDEVSAKENPDEARFEKVAAGKAKAPAADDAS